jgi:hypothetical protein
MGIFKKQKAAAPQVQMRSGQGHPFCDISGYVPMGGGEVRVYRAMREAVPILDAAVGKLCRLVGGFDVACGDKTAEAALRRFLQTVPCGRGQTGIHCFLEGYLDSLLVCGRAVGEMVVSGGQLKAVCWGDVAQVTVREGATPLEVELCGPDENGRVRPYPYQNLLLFTTRNPEPANPYGVSLLRSMPFLTDILLKIYQTVGVNWERAGNVRYSVVCKPSGDVLDHVGAAERGRQMAEQWSQAMQESKSGMVRDFVAVGDVEIKVIGADGKILDSEVPVRQLLEQLVAATGLPPFLLGLSWSTSERMSAQQTDLLTSELWGIRRTVTPALEKICDLWLRLSGYGTTAEIVWEDITLQDLVEEAQADLYRAQAAEIRMETGGDET